jgi:hypothetical protein
MSRLRTAVLTVAGGLVVAVLLFVATVPSSSYLGGPVGRPEGTEFVADFGGTDLLTGEFRPFTWSWTNSAGQRVTKVIAPDDYQNLHAIPLPVGFVVGSLLTLALITVAARRPRRRTPNSAVPAA